MKYDLIGDVHGQWPMLKRLLENLGYRPNNGVYEHSEDRVPVFLGDIIDGGGTGKQNSNRRVVETVRAMAGKGRALLLMGNHEFNAICYHTPKPGSPGEFLRQGKKAAHQHRNFLKDYERGKRETVEVIEWFKTLPVYVEFDSFRGIHACWDAEVVDHVSKHYLNLDGSLRMELFEAFSTKPGCKMVDPFSPFGSIERLLKGVEIDLPDKMTFRDKDGHERGEIRVKWWKNGSEGVRSSYRSLALGYGEDVLKKIPDVPCPGTSRIPGYSSAEKPVFFGHYWLTGSPVGQQENVCCLDYSAGKPELGGKLVSYTIDESSQDIGLDKDRLTCSD